MQYKITLTVCGSECAGIETLSGLWLMLGIHTTYDDECNHTLHTYLYMCMMYIDFDIYIYYPLLQKSLGCLMKL